MPKGQTSRPYNRKEKQALKTIQYGSGADMSQVNRNTIRSGSRNKEAYSTLSERESKQFARESGAKKEREKGQSITHRLKGKKLVKRK